MRAPFQILAIPFRKTSSRETQFGVFHRSDLNQWQFIAGGGEDDEIPIEAATSIYEQEVLKHFVRADAEKQIVPIVFFSHEVYTICIYSGKERTL